MAEHAQDHSPGPHVIELDPHGLDDLGNSERFARDHEGRVIHIEANDAWSIWDGVRWRQCETNEEWRLARETVSKFMCNSRGITDEERKAAVKANQRKLRSKSGLTAMLMLAKSDEKIAIAPRHLDRDPWQMTCRNHTLHLGRLARGETGGVLDHDPHNLITNLADVAYDATTKAPRWESFLYEVFEDDYNLIDFVQRAAGYSLTGLVNEQKCFFCQGEGANGKSVLLGALMETMGTYSQQAPGNIFLEGDRHTTELARLRGKRLVCCSEPDQSKSLSESRLKMLVSIDPIVARFLNENFAEFLPSHKVWMATNVLPRIKSQDHGTWRRPLVIPFNVTFSEDEQDKGLIDKLRAEYSGILNWRIEGLRRYLESGLELPLSVVNASAEYKREQDLLGFFVDDKLEPDLVGKISASRCYKLYEEWCAENRVADRFRMTVMSFGSKMKKRKGIYDKREGDGIYYYGVKEKQA